MIQSSAVISKPSANVFARDHTNTVSHTQVKPSAFRVNYFCDGTGRDTFVKNSNGGFYKAYSPAPAYPVTSFMQKRRYNPPAPIMKSRGVQYHSDGTGRDSYIGFNQGGLTAYGSKTVHYVHEFK